MQALYVRWLRLHEGEIRDGTGTRKDRLTYKSSGSTPWPAHRYLRLQALGPWKLTMPLTTPSLEIRTAVTQSVDERGLTGSGPGQGMRVRLLSFNGS